VGEYTRHYRPYLINFYSLDHSTCIPGPNPTLPGSIGNDATAQRTTPHLVETFEEFVANAQCRAGALAPILHQLGPNQVIMGGFVRACMLTEEFCEQSWANVGKDINLYCFSADAFLDALVKTVNVLRLQRGARASIAIGVSDTMKTALVTVPECMRSTCNVEAIQITAAFNEAPLSIISKFDFDCCMNVYDGDSVMVLPQCAVAMRSMTVRMVHRLRHPHRVARILHQGFRFRSLPSAFYATVLQEREPTLRCKFADGSPVPFSDMFDRSRPVCLDDAYGKPYVASAALPDSIAESARHSREFVPRCGRVYDSAFVIRMSQDDTVL
jgi:hypothetical protein